MKTKTDFLIQCPCCLSINISIFNKKKHNLDDTHTIIYCNSCNYKERFY